MRLSTDLKLAKRYRSQFGQDLSGLSSPLTAVCLVSCCGSMTACGAAGILDWLYSADTLAHAMGQGEEDAVMRGAALMPSLPECV